MQCSTPKQIRDIIRFINHGHQPRAARAGSRRCSCHRVYRIPCACAPLRTSAIRRLRVPPPRDSSRRRHRRLVRRPPLPFPPVLPVAGIPARLVSLSVNVGVAAGPPLRFRPAQVRPLAATARVPVALVVPVPIGVSDPPALIPLPLPLVPGPSPSPDIVCGPEFRRVVRVRVGVAAA